MIVYADVLLVLNLIVDYFLLLTSDKFIKSHSNGFRLLAGAAIGSVSSLYIFLPQTGIFVELLVRIAVCSLMVLSAFGYKSKKMFLRNIGILFSVTCVYGGIMIALWYVFKPNGMVLNNSVVYFDISPLFLIIFSVAGYFIFIITNMIFSKNNKYSEKCNITVFADDNSVDMTAIVDTGNSIEDIFGGSEVIIADGRSVKRLFGNTDNNLKLKTRYRAMPCSTVSGMDMLDGYRCDSAVVTAGERTIKLKKPILAVSKVSLDDDYSAILNPKILM